jgi:hypothetical protein
MTLRERIGLLGLVCGMTVSVFAQQTVYLNEVPGACCWEDFSCTEELPSTCFGYYGGPFTQCANSDCNQNNADDFCDIASGYSYDCNFNAIPDECEPFIDCNQNGQLDECDITQEISQDCNANGVPDECDIAAGTSQDCTANGIPDECEPDCNQNGVADSCDILQGTSTDCNYNGIPDECDIANGTSADCQPNGVPDECEVGYAHGPDAFGYTYGDSNDIDGPDLAYEDISSSGTLIVSGDDSATTTALPFTFQFYGVSYTSIAVSTNGLLNFLGDTDSYCCEGWPVPDPDSPNATIAVWWADLVTTVRVETRGTAPYQRFIVQWAGNHCCGGGTPPVAFQAKLFETTGKIELQYRLATYYDDETQSVGIENETGTIGLQYFLGDADLPTPLAVAFSAFASSDDCNGNGVPDECEPDCNANGVPDSCDLAQGTSQDCNSNGAPDECDIAGGTSQDGNGNGYPDECELRTIFANGAAGDDGWNGWCETWDGGACGPKKTIQSAVNVAVPGDTVVVADGTYTGPGNKNLDFAGKAITVRSANGPENCVIDCENDGRGFYFHTSETGAAVVDGFTITSGHALEGGGIYCLYSSPTLTNCIITGNAATGDEALGGGVFCELSSPTLTNCTISDNTAIGDDVGQGAGVYCAYGAPTITHCNIVGNSAVGAYYGGCGGGVSCVYGAPAIAHCTMVANSASGPGGAVYCFYHSNLALFGCTIAGNISSHYGGAAYCNNYSNLKLANCTVWGNTAEVAAGGMVSGYESSLALADCILWGDTPPEIYNVSTLDPIVTYCDVQGAWPGDGNIASDPLFTDPAAGDFHLLPGSPCIDAGNPSFEPLPGETDIDGEPRVQDCRVDIGADESPYFPDCNDNGIGDLCDIAAGTSQDCTANGIPDECEADCNANGVADSCDIGWGTSQDCDANGIPDECDIAAGTSDDCTTNGIPDECEADCNENGVADSCDILQGTSTDCDDNGIPDECEADCNENGVADSCDILQGTSTDCDDNGIPDECEVWIFVNWAAGDDVWNGRCETWDGGACGPKKTIQGGIDAAVDGYIVLVADGTYTGAGNRDLDLHGKTIAVRSTTGPQNCVIDCENDGRGFYFHSGETGAAIVDGFTITGGRAFSSSGGAIYCYYSHPTLKNCVITGNSASGSYPALGGGIYCDRSSPTILDCAILGNSAHGGGAILCYDHSCPTISGCSALGNIADCTLGGFGGGIACAASCNAIIENCLIAANSAVPRAYPSEGGALYCGGCAPTIHNCTIAGNMADLGGGISCYNASPVIVGSVLRGDTAEEIALRSGGQAAVTYSDVDGGWPGAGNIDADPLFVDPLTGDLHLLPGSPCIDAANNSAVPQGIDTDLDGYPRFVDDPSTPDTGVGSPPIVDMGAYEYPGADCNANGVPDAVDIASGTSTDVNANSIPDECESVGDVNCDGVTDLADINPFVLFLSNFVGWQAEFPGCDPLNGDINGDGTYGQECLSDINPFVDLITHL